MANPLVAPVQDLRYMDFLDRDVRFVLSPRLWRIVRPLVGRATAIADLGCGIGTLLFNVRQEAAPAARLVGLNMDSTHARLARSFTGADVVRGDALRPPLRDGALDLLFCTMVIEHVDDAALADVMRRLVRPGGHLVLTTVQRLPGARYFYRDEEGRALLAPDHVREYPGPGPVEELLATAGFRVAETILEPIRFSPLDSFLRAAHRLRPSPLLRRAANAPLTAALRRVTRVRVPRYRSIEILAERT